MSQIRNETPDLAKGAAKAMFDFYEVVTHDLLAENLRYIGTITCSHKYQRVLETVLKKISYGFTYVCIQGSARYMEYSSTG